MADQPTPNRLVLLVPFLIFLVIVAILSYAWYLKKDGGTDELPSALIGQSIPEFALTSLFDDTKKLGVADIEGPALVNVWATWCPACHVEHPFLVELAAEGISIYGLNYKDDRSVALQFLQKKGNPFKVVFFDGEGELGLDLGVYGAPETYFINAQGIIVHRHVGEFNRSTWDNELALVWEKL